MSGTLERGSAVVDSLAQVRIDSLARVREAQVADSLEMVRNIAREDSLTRVVETTRHLFGWESKMEGGVGVEAVAEVVNEASASIAQSGSFMVLTLAFSLLYLVWLSHIVVSGTVRWSQLKSFSREVGSASGGREVIGQQQMLMNILTWVLGIGMVAMLGVKLADIYIGISYDDLDGGVWVIGGAAVALLCALYGWTFIKVAGYLTINVDAMKELLAVKRRLFVLSILFISPVVMMMALSNILQSQQVVYILVLECIVLIVLFVWQTFLLFMRENFSILHWILYLCAVELMPLSLVWGVLRHLSL